MLGQQSPATASSISLPPPVGGWNARDALYDMPPQDAIKLVNWFPDRERCRIRNGFTSHSTGLGSGVVDSLYAFYGSSGTSKLVGCANGNIYDASTGTASSLASGFSSNRWESVMFRDRLILVNGTDQPQQYDGSTVSAATYTGIADDSVLTDVTSYRSRLYFIEGTSVWYGAVDTITGALTEFDVHSQLREGGELEAIHTWSAQTGDSFNEYLVLVSSRGEGIIYTGSNPGAGDWTLSMRFKLPKPLGVRCFLQYGADVYLNTIQGLYPLSRTVAQGNEPGVYDRLSDKIRNAFSEAARSYSANFGWQVVNYPQGHYLLVNVPVATGTAAEQYVMNTETGAWCKFTGQNAQSWVVWDDDLYFGGTDGAVYKADNGNADAMAHIPHEMQQAFNYCQAREVSNRTNKKLFSMVRPILETDSATTLGVDIDVDFGTTTMEMSERISGTGGTAWGSAWGSPWSPVNRTVDNWYGVGAIGRAMSLKLKGECKDTNVALSSTDVLFTAGGYV